MDLEQNNSLAKLPLLKQEERFMNYLEEQADGEAMINSIRNGEHPLLVVAQVSLAGTAPNAPPTLKDPHNFWTTKEKMTRKTTTRDTALKLYGMLLKGRYVDPLAWLVRNTNVSKRKEKKLLVQSDSEGSDDKDISDLKKITALLAKAFNRKKYYAKPTNNNVENTSSASSSATRKPEEYMKSEERRGKEADE
ncbi:hypothetical protein Tco_0172904 [Tanacetum coccineum]